MSTPFRFLALPLELQHNVFRKVYEEPSVLIGEKNCALSISWYGGAPVDLLLTCSHIYREALPFHRRSPIDLDISALGYQRLDRWLNFPGRDWLFPQIRVLTVRIPLLASNWNNHRENIHKLFRGLKLDLIRYEFEHVNDTDYDDSEWLHKTLYSEPHASLYTHVSLLTRENGIQASRIELRSNWELWVAERIRLQDHERLSRAGKGTYTADPCHTGCSFREVGRTIRGIYGGSHWRTRVHFYQVVREIKNLRGPVYEEYIPARVPGYTGCRNDMLYFV